MKIKSHAHGVDFEQVSDEAYRVFVDGHPALKSFDSVRIVESFEHPLAKVNPNLVVVSPAHSDVCQYIGVQKQCLEKPS